MFKAFFIIAALALLNAAAAIEWSSESEETVHPGVNITKGDFLINVMDFDANSKLIRLMIYKQNTSLREDILSEGKESIYDDELKISVIEIWSSEKGEKWARLKIYLSSRPELRISISTDKNEYSPGNAIVSTITVRNNGNETIRNVEVNIYPGFLELRNGNLKTDLGDMTKGQSRTLNLEFKVPLTDAGYTSITLNASGKDLKNVIYFASAQRKIKIIQKITSSSGQTDITVRTEPVVLTKSVDSLVASRGDEITVNIRAWNEGEKRAILNITDELPEGTILASGDLSRDVVLEKNRSIDYSYTLRLIRGGQIELPATRAINKYSNYTVEVSSGYLTILAIEPSQDMATPTSGETPKKADGFEAVLVVVNFLIIFFVSSELCTVFKIRK